MCTISFHYSCPWIPSKSCSVFKVSYGSFMQTKHYVSWSTSELRVRMDAPLNRFKPSSKIFYLHFFCGSFMFFSVLCLLCLCTRLFTCALRSPAGKGLTSWLSFVVSNCEFVTFPFVSRVRCGTWLNRFLIFAPYSYLEKTLQTAKFLYYL